MKIIHVVTLVTPDGSLGGPLRVAINQVDALISRGHDVILAAAAQGYEGNFPPTYDGVPVKLFPAHQIVPGTGFAGLTSPALLLWLSKVAKSADLVQIHMARDLVTLPAARLVQLLGVPTVIQTHGMIDKSERALAKPLDFVGTRPVFARAKKILALTKCEASDLQETDSSLPTEKIELVRNGVPETDWSISATEQNKDVLFLARMQERKRPVEFVKMAQRLAKKNPDFTFSMVGPDEGQGEEVRKLLADNNANGRIRWEGSLPSAQTLARMGQSIVYVLPSKEEPYGMTVVEAMSIALPVVVMDDCGLAEAVLKHDAGQVAGYDKYDLDKAVQALIDSEALRTQQGANGREFVRSECTMGEIAAQLEKIYLEATR